MSFRERGSSAKMTLPVGKLTTPVHRVIGKFEKEFAQFFKISPRLLQVKKGQNIYNKAQFENPKHLHQITFETLKYLQQIMF